VTHSVVAADKGPRPIGLCTANQRREGKE